MMVGATSAQDAAIEPRRSAARDRPPGARLRPLASVPAGGAVLTTSGASIYKQTRMRYGIARRERVGL